MLPAYLPVPLFTLTEEKQAKKQAGNSCPLLAITSQSPTWLLGAEVHTLLDKSVQMLPGGVKQNLDLTHSLYDP